MLTDTHTQNLPIDSMHDPGIGYAGSGVCKDVYMWMEDGLLGGAR